MIPEQRLSSQSLPAPLLNPIPRDDPFTDYQIGGVGIQDPTQGFRVKLWRLRYIELTGEFLIDSPDDAPIVAFVRFNISYVSLSFDTNMNPFVSFTEAGVSKFWWFDTVLNAQVFDDTTIATAITPYAFLDDVRPSQAANVDNILVYIRGGSLYFRAQRDRYTIEYFLRSGVVGDVLLAGMQTNLRVGITVGSF
jgi:hypothetical protein